MKINNFTPKFMKLESIRHIPLTFYSFFEFQKSYNVKIVNYDKYYDT